MPCHANRTIPRRISYSEDAGEESHERHGSWWWLDIGSNHRHGYQARSIEGLAVSKRIAER